jgi:hypothetical protein
VTRACPVCGAGSVPFLFGLPVEEAKAAAAAGDLVLAGCFWDEERAPHYRCSAGHDWRVDDSGVWYADMLAVLARHGYVDDYDEAPE